MRKAWLEYGEIFHGEGTFEDLLLAIPLERDDSRFEEGRFFTLPELEARDKEHAETLEDRDTTIEAMTEWMGRVEVGLGFERGTVDAEEMISKIEAHAEEVKAAETRGAGAMRVYLKKYGLAVWFTCSTCTRLRGGDKGSNSYRCSCPVNTFPVPCPQWNLGANGAKVLIARRGLEKSDTPDTAAYEQGIRVKVLEEAKLAVAQRCKGCAHHQGADNTVAGSKECMTCRTLSAHRDIRNLINGE